jgi:hypothetical protein
MQANQVGQLANVIGFMQVQECDNAADCLLERRYNPGAFFGEFLVGDFFEAGIEFGRDVVEALLDFIHRGIG